MKEKNLYIQTIGCQMNVYDSERMESLLSGMGYRSCVSPEDADLIIVNTCSIREKAEQKAFSFLGRLNVLKKKNPGLVIGVGGCVAQQEGGKILKRMPLVDMVFGTRAMDRLPAMIQKVRSQGIRIVETDLSPEYEDGVNSYHGPFAKSGPTGFVTIMRGCDNFCTYCVVPYVRGRETSRPPGSIVEEIRDRVKAGMRDVTLLGQNVNSYGKKEELCSFPELLAKVNDIQDLWRIRFTTSHPKDMSDALIESFKELEKLCDHIHLPVQSGSNGVLKKMNRRYTREDYLKKIEKLRNSAPSLAVTSDMIVGFPGETRRDFQETLDLMKEVRFDGIFAFAYSDRPNAPAVGFVSKLDEKEKKERLAELLDLQEGYTREKNKEFVGKTVQVLVEGVSKKTGSDPQWTGRTTTNKIVNFRTGKGPADDLSGTMLDIRIEKAFSHSLKGKAIDQQTVCDSKGDRSYVA